MTCCVLFKVGEADGNGALMAEVSTQAQYPNGAHHEKIGLEVGRIGTLDGPVVDQHDVKSAMKRGDGSIELANQFLRGNPIVAKRHEYCDV
jgi:hypothetical protein